MSSSERELTAPIGAQPALDCSERVGNGRDRSSFRDAASSFTLHSLIFAAQFREEVTF